MYLTVRWLKFLVPSIWIYVENKLEQNEWTNRIFMKGGDGWINNIAVDDIIGLQAYFNGHMVVIINIYIQ